MGRWRRLPLDALRPETRRGQGGGSTQGKRRIQQELVLHIPRPHLPPFHQVQQSHCTLTLSVYPNGLVRRWLQEVFSFLSKRGMTGLRSACLVEKMCKMI